MNLIREKTAYYPAFHLGCKPAAVECKIAIMEANGKRYLKTPFALLSAYADDDIERQIGEGRGYYATEEETLAYLSREYPNADRAEPIMDRLCELRHHYGPTVGTARAADEFGASSVSDEIFRLARGHRSFTLKQIKDALKLTHVAQ